MGPILVTGAGGQVGGIGHKVVASLLHHKVPVRAMVRTHDARAEGLTRLGAEVVGGDLTLPPHVAAHLSTMAQLHHENRYDRHTADVQKITGTPAMTIRDWVDRHRERFDPAARGEKP